MGFGRASLVPFPETGHHFFLASKASFKSPLIIATRSGTGERPSGKFKTKINLWPPPEGWGKNHTSKNAFRRTNRQLLEIAENEPANDREVWLDVVVDVVGLV